MIGELRRVVRDLRDVELLGAREFVDRLEAALKALGWRTARGVEAKPGAGRKAELDLVVLEPERISIQCDRKSPRKASLAKLRSAEGHRVVVLSEEPEKPPRIAGVTVLVAGGTAAERREEAQRAAAEKRRQESNASAAAAAPADEKKHTKAILERLSAAPKSPIPVPASPQPAPTPRMADPEKLERSRSEALAKLKAEEEREAQGRDPTRRELRDIAQRLQLRTAEEDPRRDDAVSLLEVPDGDRGAGWLQEAMELVGATSSNGHGPKGGA